MILKIMKLWFYIALLTGCTTDTNKNEQLPNTETEVTRASKDISVTDLPDGHFVGIAISGGGSRATNLSAAVLLELEKLGVLDKAAVISSVSGGSVTAAYYGLYGSDPVYWNTDVIRERFMIDFEQQWLLKLIHPEKIYKRLFSDYTRTDSMAEVLDDELYHGSKFRNLNPSGIMNPPLPRIILNATDYTNGEQFGFTDQAFKNKLNSRLDTYPLANAVMSSSAFPGVFNSVTVKDYRMMDNEYYSNKIGVTNDYGHFIDGGMSDNLGVDQIRTIVYNLYNKPIKPSSCLLVIIDSAQYQEKALDSNRDDSRRWYDFLLDTNAITSSDVLLSNSRLRTMMDLGMDVSDKTILPYIGPKEHVNKPTDNCSIWFISIQRMFSPMFEYNTSLEQPDNLYMLRHMRKIVNNTPTRYKVVGHDGESPKGTQDAIFKAAEILVHKDKVWMNGNFHPISDVVCKSLGMSAGCKKK